MPCPRISRGSGRPPADALGSLAVAVSLAPPNTSGAIAICVTLLRARLVIETLTYAALALPPRNPWLAGRTMAAFGAAAAALLGEIVGERCGLGEIELSRSAA